MCFVLYVGTAKPLPRQEWRQEAPDLSVESLDERSSLIRAYFSKSEVQYVGSTAGCGCDFPHVILQNGGWPMACRENDAEQAAIHRRNRAALVRLLRETGEETIEIYGLWDGDFAEPPKSRETIQHVSILDADFYFKEQGFYTISLAG